MFKTYAGICILLCLFACNSATKKTAAQTNVHPLDTLPNGKILLDNLDSGMYLYYKEVVGSDTLRGGYITCYGFDDSMRYLYLRHKDTLHLLNQAPVYVSPWSLGTVFEDYTTFFITRIDNGNSSPSSYQVFDKKTGRNMLGDNVEACSLKKWNGNLFMLYDNHIGSKMPDSITLVNVQSGELKNFKLPAGLPDPCDIQIDKLTKHSVRVICSGIAHYGEQEEKIITYSR